MMKSLPWGKPALRLVVLLTASVIAWGGVAWAGESPVKVSLPELIELAMGHSSRIKTDYYNQLVSYYDQLDPRFSTELDLLVTQSFRTRARRLDVVNSPPGFPNQFIIGRKSNLSVALEAEMPLALSGIERLSKRAARWEYAQVHFLYLRNREEVAAEVTDLFWKVVLAKKRDKLFGELIELYEETLNRYRQRYQEGEEFGYKVKEAEFLLADARHQRKVNQLEMKRNVFALSQLTGANLKAEWFPDQLPRLPERVEEVDFSLIKKRVYDKLARIAPRLEEELTSGEIGGGMRYSWLTPALTITGRLQNRGDFARQERSKVIGVLNITAHFNLREKRDKTAERQRARIKQRQANLIRNRELLISDLADAWVQLIEDADWLTRVYSAQRAWLEEELRVARLRYEDGLGTFESYKLKREQLISLELERLDRISRVQVSRVGLEFWLEMQLTPGEVKESG